jgi:hypothetical protein
MGMVLGNLQVKELKEILYFKESISILLISILFILLAANINMEDMMLLYRWETVYIFLIVVFVLRPLSVFVSTHGSNLSKREKSFISWVGPRGIVAAGIASLFGLKLAAKGEPGAEYITPLVFMIVLGTVLLNATTARFMAKLLGVFLTKSDGIIIVGASKISRLIADYLQKNDRRVVLIDSNVEHINNAKSMGLEAIEGNVYSDELLADIELNDVGFLLSLTGSTSVNNYVIDKFKPMFGEQGAYRLVSSEEMKSGINVNSTELFTDRDDFINLSEIVRDFPIVNEVEVDSKEAYNEIMSKLISNDFTVPLFLKEGEGEIHILAAVDDDYLDVSDGCKIMYLGKTIM